MKPGVAPHPSYSKAPLSLLQAHPVVNAALVAFLFSTSRDALEKSVEEDPLISPASRGPAQAISHSTPKRVTIKNVLY